MFQKVFSENRFTILKNGKIVVNLPISSRLKDLVEEVEATDELVTKLNADPELKDQKKKSGHPFILSNYTDTGASLNIPGFEHNTEIIRSKILVLEKYLVDNPEREDDVLKGIAQTIIASRANAWSTINSIGQYLSLFCTRYYENTGALNGVVDKQVSREISLLLPRFQILPMGNILATVSPSLDRSHFYKYVADELNPKNGYSEVLSSTGYKYLKPAVDQPSTELLFNDESIEDAKFRVHTEDDGFTLGIGDEIIGNSRAHLFTGYSSIHSNGLLLAVPAVALYSISTNYIMSYSCKAIGVKGQFHHFDEMVMENPNIEEYANKAIDMYIEEINKSKRNTSEAYEWALEVLGR